MDQKQKMYLTAEAIYKYLLGTDEKIDTLVMCKSSEYELISTDQSLYEAIGAIEDKTKINFNKLVKLLEVTSLMSFDKTMNKPRTILTDERAEEIRNPTKKSNDEGK